MKTKEYERESVVGSIGIGVILVVVIFVGYVIFTANPGEVVRQTMEENAAQKEEAEWNKEIATLIREGDMDAAIALAESAVGELTVENSEVIQGYRKKAEEEAKLIAQALGEIRDTYLAGEKKLAESSLRTLSRSYPDSDYIKAYLELICSVEKVLTEEDMYDWKYGGKPGYGTYKDYRGNAITGFCFSSHYITNGEYGFFDTKSYSQVTVEATCITMGSETIPVTITDLKTDEKYVIDCPKGSICETVEITGGDIQISTPDDSNYSYGNVALVITLKKELTEADFAAIDARF